MAQSAAVIQIDRIEMRTVLVPIVGMTPLVMHRFSQKAKAKMLDAMRGKKSPKQAKDPEDEFKQATYRLKEGYGFPAVAFKLATVGAARFYPRNDVTMTGLRQCLFFHGEVGSDGLAMVRIANPNGGGEEWPKMREDVVRVARGGTDLRYRPEFWPWSAELRISFVASALTQDSVVSLVEAGGLGVGVGEWRPERKGDMGTYRVDTEKKIEVL